MVTLTNFLIIYSVVLGETQTHTNFSPIVTTESCDPKCLLVEDLAVYPKGKGKASPPLY